MRFLFRSAMRGVARSPLQTLILILTILLSAMLFAMIAETSFSVVEESTLARAAKYGKADISISADADSDSSYIGTADVAAVLGEGDLYSGYMVLPAYDSYGTDIGAVTDFNTINHIFDFSFTEYGTVTTQNINSVIFVSEEFAAQRGISVGDSCTINVLGISMQYTVQAINKYAFFGSYGFIINAGGALDVLSSVSPVFTVFGEDNIPCSTVYVRTNGDVTQKIQSINDNLSADGWTAKIAGGTAREYINSIITILIPVAVLFTAVIAGVLVYFSLNIISDRRKQETLNFILAGMPASKVGFAFIAETLLYLVVGTAAGIALAGVVLPLMGAMSYTSFSLTWRGVLICIAAQLMVEIIAVSIYVLRGRRRREIKNVRIYAVIIAAVAVVLAAVALSYLIAVDYLYILSITGFIAIIALLFACARPLCRAAAGYIAPRAERSGRGAGVLSLALKNTANTSEVHNIMRVLSVLVSVMIVAVCCISYTSTLIEDYTGFLNCDYIVLNADSSVAEEVALTEGTKSYCICGIYSGEFANGELFYLADVEDAGFINGNFFHAEGNGVYMSKNSADLLGVSVGDTFTVKISGVECSLVLCGYTGGGIIGYIDADYFGFSKDVVLVRSDGSSGYLYNLSGNVAVYGAFVQTPDSLFSMQVKNVNNIVKILTVYLSFMCIVAAVGVANLVGVSYAARKNQFRSLILVGMTRADVAKMIVYEALILLLYTAVFSAASGALLCYFLNNGMRSFGFSLFS